MPDIEIYFDKDRGPGEFVEECFSEWKTHYDDNIRDTEKECLELFQNYSKRLAELKEDKFTKRSCLFIPMIMPHVLTRVAHFIGVLVGGDPFAKWLPLPGSTMENAERLQNLVIRRFLGDKMEKIDDLSQLLSAAETRKVAWVKIRTERETWDELVVEQDELDFSEIEKSKEEIVATQEEVGLRVNLPIPDVGIPLRRKRNVKKMTGEEHPVWELLSAGAFFHDPYPSNRRNWLFCGDIKYVSSQYLRDMERKGFYKNIQEAIDKEGVGAKPAYADDTILNRQQSGIKGTIPIEKGEHKHFLKECWARIPSNNPKEGKVTGESEIRVITTVNGVEVRNTKTPYLQIMFPYVGFKAIALPNELEGMSTAEIERHLQHAKNDIYNQRIDAGTYAIHSPLQKDTRCKVLSDPIWAPNAVWNVEKLKEYGGVQPMVNPQSAGMVRNWFAEDQAIEETAENLSASTDLVQGGTLVKADKTLGQAAMRHQGAMTRINLSLVLYSSGIIQILDMFSKIYQERIDLKKGMTYFTGRYENGIPIDENLNYDNIRGRFKITMPYVTEYVDKSTQRLMWTMLFDRLRPDPIFMQPVRHYKLVERFLQSYSVKELEDLIGSPPDLKEEFMQELLMRIFGQSMPGRTDGGVEPTMSIPRQEGVQPEMGMRTRI